MNVGSEETKFSDGPLMHLQEKVKGMRDKGVSPGVEREMDTAWNGN